MEEYSQDLQLAFKQWHYNAMQGIVRSYGFCIGSGYSEFRNMNYDQALYKIKNESSKLFIRLEKMAKNYG